MVCNMNLSTIDKLNSNNYNKPLKIIKSFLFIIENIIKKPAKESLNLTC